MFSIDYRSRKPIYEQVCDKIKELIALDLLTQGDKLPTVRSLAKETGTNPNTIQKSFAKLESEGIIFSVSGKGSFVNIGDNERNEMKSHALDEIEKVIEKNKIYNITYNDIKTIAKKILLKEEQAND